MSHKRSKGPKKSNNSDFQANRVRDAEACGDDVAATFKGISPSKDGGILGKIGCEVFDSDSPIKASLAVGESNLSRKRKKLKAASNFAVLRRGKSCSGNRRVMTQRPLKDAKLNQSPLERAMENQRQDHHVGNGSGRNQGKFGSGKSDTQGILQGLNKKERQRGERDPNQQHQYRNKQNQLGKRFLEETKPPAKSAVDLGVVINLTNTEDDATSNAHPPSKESARPKNPYNPTKNSRTTYATRHSSEQGGRNGGYMTHIRNTVNTKRGGATRPILYENESPWRPGNAQEPEIQQRRSKRTTSSTQYSFQETDSDENHDKSGATEQDSIEEIDSDDESIQQSLKARTMTNKAPKFTMGGKERFLDRKTPRKPRSIGDSRRDSSSQVVVTVDTASNSPKDSTKEGRGTAARTKGRILTEDDSIKDVHPDNESTQQSSKTIASGSHTITKKPSRPKVTTQDSLDLGTGTGKIPRKGRNDDDNQRDSLISAETKANSPMDAREKGVHVGSRPLGLTRQKGPQGKRPRSATKIIPGSTLHHHAEDRQGETSPMAQSKRRRKSGRISDQEKQNEPVILDLMSDDDEIETPAATQESEGADRDRPGSTSTIKSVMSTATRLVGSAVKAISDTVTKTLSPTRQTERPSRAAKACFKQYAGRVWHGNAWWDQGGKIIFNKGQLAVFVKGEEDPLEIVSFNDGAPDVKRLVFHVGCEVVETDSQEKEGCCAHFLAFQLWDKSFCVIEFESSSTLTELVQRIQKVAPCYKDLEAFPKKAASALYNRICPSSGEGSGATKKKSKRGRKRRSPEPKVTDRFVQNREQDDVLLVYPFAGNPQKIEEAAANLNEASGKIRINTDTGENSSTIADDMANCSLHEPSGSPHTKPAAAAGTGADVSSKTEQRRHFLTIQVRDFERLCPGEFLNDSLIDFWLQWITRHIDPTEGTSPIHCFSSHFFTTLVEEGVNSVTKWTAKKDINIFEKKFVFIPINETLHWSLCVVVNPGHILDESEDGPMPCLLFLDSLKAHRKKKVSNRVRAWLNSEWQRINGGSQNPFSEDSCRLLDPRIPYQNNSWDCGVFVCRYAFAVLSLRDRPFNRSDNWFQKDLCSNCDAFDFDMGDIARLRDEMRELIERLSVMYIPWKEAHDKKLKDEKRARKEKLRQQKHAEAQVVEEEVPVSSEEVEEAKLSNHGNLAAVDPTPTEDSSKEDAADFEGEAAPVATDTAIVDQTEEVASADADEYVNRDDYPAPSSDNAAIGDVVEQRCIATEEFESPVSLKTSLSSTGNQCMHPGMGMAAAADREQQDLQAQSFDMDFNHDLLPTVSAEPRSFFRDSISAAHYHPGARLALEDSSEKENIASDCSADDDAALHTPVKNNGRVHGSSPEGGLTPKSESQVEEI